jgi:hypothetical protein
MAQARGLLNRTRGLVAEGCCYREAMHTDDLSENGSPWAHAQLLL